MAEQSAGRPWRWLGAIMIVVGVMLWIVALLYVCGGVPFGHKGPYSI
jgi:hypothetical protein